MADARTGPSPGGAARRALAAALMLAAFECRADGVDSTAGAAVAFSSATAPAGVAGLLAGPAAGGGAAMPFRVRREANPRYRPPTVGVPGIGPGAVSRMRALDRLGVELFHSRPGDARSTTQWRVAAGEQYRSNDALELVATGGKQRGTSRLHALRAHARFGGLSASLGDAEPFQLGRLAYLPRLRGGVVRLSGADHSKWLLMAGVPTPVPGFATPRLGLGGIMAEGLRFDEGALSFTLVGFARAATPASVLAAPDTLAGSGTAGVFGWRAPLGAGTLGGRLGAQLHDLDPSRSVAVQHAIEWSLTTPRWTVAVSDERNTRHARVLGTDQITPTPRREERWNLQTRFGRGRSESHFTGVLRDGGDPALEARTLQLGGSGRLGAAGWYGGGDATWDRRAFPGIEERRFSLHSGGALARGHALLARVELAARPGGDALTSFAEASLALPRGLRLELEPSAGWNQGRLGHGQLATRLTWPLSRWAARVTGGLTFGASRDLAFRGSLQEASVALSCSPRLRDRADLEARRVDRDGRAMMEYTTSYEAQRERYETLGGWSATRDTGRVSVRVVRSGNGRGVADVVVSLDGRQLRFTDADGFARFERVPPGVHVVSVEEHSLPANHQVVTASRVFVTVERGRAPEPVGFTIARQERRTRF